MKSEHYSIGHTLATPLPDGRVNYTPCRRCGEECRGHSVAGAQRAEGCVTIDRKTAEVLSAAAFDQAQEVRRMAESCMSFQAQVRDQLIAEADEIDAARAALDVAMARLS